MKDRVYDISLEPTPTNSQNMNDDAEPTTMVNDEDNTSQQSPEKQVQLFLRSKRIYRHKNVYFFSTIFIL